MISEYQFGGEGRKQDAGGGASLTSEFNIDEFVQIIQFRFTEEIVCDGDYFDLIRCQTLSQRKDLNAGEMCEYMGVRVTAQARAFSIRQRTFYLSDRICVISEFLYSIQKLTREMKCNAGSSVEVEGVLDAAQILNVIMADTEREEIFLGKK